MLNQGLFRERVAEFMIDAAEKLRDAVQLLTGKRERFFSQMSDHNMLDLIKEAANQNVKDSELDTIIEFFTTSQSVDKAKDLYIKALLMSGRLDKAFDMVKKEKGMGWSYQSNAGVVFGSVLYVLSGYSKEVDTIKILLKGYANQTSRYSGHFSIQDDDDASFYDEIINGLKQVTDMESQAVDFLLWAEKIGKSRVDYIVSNKHRGAYERAAQVLGSLAETYLAMGQKSKAVKLLHSYYSEKYNRFSAFRKEVKSVVSNSNLLRNCGFMP